MISLVIEHVVCRQVPPAGLQVLCDPGTDCADCGPFRFNASTAGGASFQADLPVRRLRSQQVTARRCPCAGPCCCAAITSQRAV